MLGDCKNSGREARGPRNGEVKMKTPFVIAFVTVVLAAVSPLAIMNKSGPHDWCAPASSIRHQLNTGHS